VLAQPTDPSAHPDEYISTATYNMAGNIAAWGCFLNADGTAGNRLLTYANLQDFRATQESCAIVAYNDPRPSC
jgi:hypothetical protein